MEKIDVIWFRRDLRLYDNVALHHAIKSERKLLPIFIFDENIINELPVDDHRVNFIYDSLEKMQHQLASLGGGLQVFRGKPIEIWEQITNQFDVNAVYSNRDFEQYGVERDEKIAKALKNKDIAFHQFTDHIIFNPGEIVKNDGQPYKVYTPFKNQWLKAFSKNQAHSYDCELNETEWMQSNNFPNKEKLGIQVSKIKAPSVNFEHVDKYHELRNTPEKDATTKVGVHLRFGTISIRELIRKHSGNETYFSELIWREFFIHILHFYPHSVNQSFRPEYDNIKWENNEEHFKAWCEGKTGYHMVDAGMRELNETGFMHNRVRMLTASFLCKHLLIDWRWGEAYFAKKLFDFELASNVGNWQWAAGTGCDASPYFRVFNPMTQREKFDPNYIYVKKWIPEIGTPDYPRPIVEHKSARLQAIERYKQGLGKL